MDTSHAKQWRERDFHIRSLAAVHPFTVQHIQHLFSCRSAAYRRIAILRRRRKLRHIGLVQRKSAGRPTDVYCNGWRPKTDHLEHELYLTDFLLCYPDAEIVRGPQVDQKIRPDATMLLNGRQFHVELDTGLESHSQVIKRQRDAYRGVTDFVLYVTLSERRRRGLIERCEAIRSIALFATLTAVLGDPHGNVWLDAYDKSAAI